MWKPFQEDTKINKYLLHTYYAQAVCLVLYMHYHVEFSVTLWASSITTFLILRIRRLGFREIYLLEAHSIPCLGNFNSFIFNFLLLVFLNLRMIYKFSSEHSQWEWVLTINSQNGYTTAKDYSPAWIYAK